jgi:hypothetical protein
MQKALIIILVFLTTQLHLHAQNGETIHLKGEVTDKYGVSVPFVNVINLSKRTGIAADFYGKFSFLANMNDTIQFTAVGFKIKRFVIPDTINSGKYYLNLILSADTICLEKAVVYPWPANEKALIQDYLELELPDETIDLHLPEKYGYINRTSSGAVGITMPGPVSVLYDIFSHEAKMRRLYESLIKKDNQKKYIASRISKNLIERITGLKDPDEIDAFLEFCDLSYEYVLASTDYEIITSLQECYKNYIANNDIQHKDYSE